jgi:peptidoglycan/xylan/chitin deacetylase (PgdA/CDA1 family)
VNALSVTFDNLGEAAEIQLGSEEATGDHESVTRSLPIVLELLERHGVEATFFCEGLNAEVYPDALREIASRGHEVAYHAWCHEQWGELSPDEERNNLRRGAAAFRDLGFDLHGFRPPGGEITERTMQLLQEEGFSYVSPAGSRERPGVLPFRWEEVDAFHVLPVFEEQRRELLGSEEAGGVEAIREHLLGGVRRVAEEGGYAALVLHNGMIEMEQAVVEELLAEASRRADIGDLWLARCDEVARRFADGQRGTDEAWD